VDSIDSGPNCWIAIRLTRTGFDRDPVSGLESRESVESAIKLRTLPEITQIMRGYETPDIL